MTSETSTPLRWGTMIPLVGGSALGCFQATSCPPTYHLSYGAFRANESHLRSHWRGQTTPWHYIDQEDSKLTYPDLLAGQMDFINSVCPCAGLSMLNAMGKGKVSRGASAAQNKWMLDSAEFVLGTVKPKVLWGENAPALFLGAEDLVATLVELGRQHGYSFSLVRTDSRLHGLPQRRLRTFYFFWRSPTVPLLRWKARPAPRLLDYLALIPPSASLQDVYVHDGLASQRYLPYAFLLHKERLTHAQFSHKYQRGTVAQYLERHGLFDECLAWLRDHHPRETFSLQEEGRGSKNMTFIDKLEHMKHKLSLGLGYWDDSLRFMGDYFNAVISKNIAFAVHPTEDRFFSVRELLHLMGMPHDFELEDPRRKMNHLCQNVPVNTAADWAEEVVRFCRGEAEMTEVAFLRQDNVAQRCMDSLPGEKKGVKKEKTERKILEKETNAFKKEFKDQILLKEEVKCEKTMNEEFNNEMLLNEDLKGALKMFIHKNDLNEDYIEETLLKEEQEDRMMPKKESPVEVRDILNNYHGQESLKRSIKLLLSTPKSKKLLKDPIQNTDVPIEDCRECKYCRDKKKYGGQNKMKQSCVLKPKGAKRRNKNVTI